MANEGEGAEATSKRTGPRFGDSPARVLGFLAANPGTAFTPAEISRNTGIDSHLVRNTLYRLSGDEDGRIAKVGDGKYQFYSMDKRSAA